MLNIVHTDNLDLFTQLELEESLIKSDENSWCLINHGTSPYIVMGVSNKPDELLNLNMVKQDEIQIIKRFSGGGTVFVDENTIFVTFIFSKKELSFSYPSEIMKWTENFYKQIFIETDFSCMENDYVINNRKCCGNAQYIRQSRWLHHSCFLWDYNVQNMNYLKIPEKAPNYRKKRDHDNFLCSINSHFTSKKHFIDKIKETLKANFQTREIKISDISMNQEKSYKKTTVIL